MTEAHEPFTQPRYEPFLVVGQNYETLDEAWAVCSESLPDLSTARTDASGNRDYRPILELVEGKDGKLHGFAGNAAQAIFDGSPRGRTLSSCRSELVPTGSQPGVLGASVVGCFEEPVIDPDTPELLTPAFGDRPLLPHLSSPSEHIFDLLDDDSWHRLPETPNFRAILEAPDPLAHARNLTDLSPQEALGAIVIEPQIRKFGLREAIQEHNVELIFAAEALRLGIAFNRDTTEGREFELLAMPSIAVIMRGTEHLTYDRINRELVGPVLWGDQPDVRQAFGLGDLRPVLKYLDEQDLDSQNPPVRLPTAVCLRGFCVESNLNVLFRIDEINKSPESERLDSLIAAAV